MDDVTRLLKRAKPGTKVCAGVLLRVCGDSSFQAPSPGHREAAGGGDTKRSCEVSLLSSWCSPGHPSEHRVRQEGSERITGEH